MDKELKDSILKTGTLTLGIVCKDGIVLAADIKQSYGSGGGVSYIAGKGKKIIEINDQIVVTTAGTASDTRKVANVLRAELRLKELKSRSTPNIKQAASLLSNMLYQNIRNLSMFPSIAHFLLAGYDDEGVHLFNANPDGYLEEADDYSVTGSGLYQAHPILDAEYKKNITVEEGIKLAVKCIKASMGRDPGVGEGIDVYVIKEGEIKSVLAKDFVTELKDRQ